ncbi:MAG TPA: hypothetical protein VHR27_14140 [Blastocatellia bacterium]|nr:hypothetical protein [Blastocatellia bacterium]
MPAPLFDVQVFNHERRAPKWRLRRADLSASGQEYREKEGQGDEATGRQGDRATRRLSKTNLAS